jgi:release factor glutamine methyltransferase
VPEHVATCNAALLDGATAQLARSGLDNPRREALVLMAWVLGQSPADVLLSRHREADASTAKALDSAVARRVAGDPVAYVTGSTGFRYLTVGCDPRALIPRPETELLVELILRRVSTGVAADIGTGTGCIALSLAREGKFDTVLAVDYSAGAVALARENAEDAATAISLIHGDLATALGSASIDALVANPPYLTTNEYERLDPAVRLWEPRLALESGRDGLDASRSLLGQAAVALRPGGWIGLEVDSTRASAVARLAKDAGFESVTIELDLFERERFVMAQKES